MKIEKNIRKFLIVRSFKDMSEKIYIKYLSTRNRGGSTKITDIHSITIDHQNIFVLVGEIGYGRVQDIAGSSYPRRWVSREMVATEKIDLNSPAIYIWVETDNDTLFPTDFICAGINRPHIQNFIHVDVGMLKKQRSVDFREDILA
jgi:hypothetical protein